MRAMRKTAIRASTASTSVELPLSMPVEIEVIVAR